MPSFDDDFALANAMFESVFSFDVSIQRGATVVSGITAEVTAQNYHGRDAERFRNNIITTLHSMDFAIAPADYDFGSGAVEPRAGDRIIRTIRGVDHHFEVVHTPDGQACEWADPLGDRWLVHTKR